MAGRLSLRGRLFGLSLATMCMVGTLVAGTSRVQAQEVSGQQRKAAAEAYDRGTSAWLAGQYAQAAQWFETAHRLAPSPAALVQAIRSHKEAGNTLRAASLSLWLKAEYNDDPRANKVADGILEDAEPNYTKVAVECDQECSITSDGKVQEYNQFFVEPGVKHDIVAGFEYGDKKATVEGAPGKTKELSFEAPPKPPEPKKGQPGYVAPAQQPWPGVPKWLTLTAIGVTAALGGVTIWQGVETLKKRDDYEAAAATCTAPCTEARQLLADGHDLEFRTNLLIGITAGVGALTLVTAIFFTNWSGESTESEEAVPEGEGAPGGATEAEKEARRKVDWTGGFAYQPGGGVAVLGGRF